MPFCDDAEIDVGYARVRAARMSYVGGPGYELYVPTDQCVTLYDALWTLRRRLRLEGCRLLHDRRAAHRSRPARLGRRAVARRNAVGSGARLRGEDGQAGRLHRPRSAARATRRAASRKRLVLFTFDDPAAFPWGGEPILMDGRNVGELTSTGYSAAARPRRRDGLRARGRPALTDDACSPRATRSTSRATTVGDAASQARLGHMRCIRQPYTGRRFDHDRCASRRSAAQRPDAIRSLHHHRPAAAARLRSPAPPTGQVQSLTRGLSLLEALAEAEGGITLTDLAQRVQPAAVDHASAARRRSRRWATSTRPATSASGTSACRRSPSAPSFLANRDFVAQSHAYMRRLMEQSGETANLGDPRRHRGRVHRPGAVPRDDAHDRASSAAACRCTRRASARRSSRRCPTSRSTRSSRSRACRASPATRSRARDDVGGAQGDPPARLVVRRRGACARHALRRRADLRRARGAAGRDLAGGTVVAPARRAHQAARPVVAHTAEELTRRLGGRWPHPY